MSATKFYVSAETPITQDAEGFEALTELGGVEKHPCQGGCEACVGCNVPENSL